MKARILMQLGMTITGLLLLLVPAPARADFTFDLNVGNTSGPPLLSSFPGPYAQVDVHLTDSTHATITFTSLTNSGNIYLMGDGSSVAVNLNATSWKLGSITGSNAGTGFTPGPWSDAGSNQVDGFGTFNQTFKSFDGFTHSSDTISLIVANTGGTWGNASDVLAANSDGHLAAAHIFVTSSPANANDTAYTTGYASDGTKQELSVVPAPSSIIAALTGMALFGVIGIAGYRRRARVMLGA